MGSNYNFRLGNVISPYFGGFFGALNTVWKDKYYREVWYFVLGLQGGSKFYLNKWLGLSVQAEMLFQVHPEKAPFLYSMDRFNIPVNAMSNMIRGGVSASVVFRFGK